MNDTALRAAIWLMDASDTLETSRELCLRCARANGLVVQHQFVSKPARYGRSQAFVDLLRRLETGDIAVVIVASLSELARSVPELRDIVDALAETNCRLIVAGEAIDTGAPGIGGFAAVVTALVRWRPFLNRQVLSAKSGSPGRATSQPRTITPFGFCWHEGVMEADPHEAPIRARVFELFSDIGQVAEVAAILNTSGARRRDRTRFTPTDIRRIIRDPIAKGVYRGNKRTPVPRMRTRGEEPGPLVAVRPLVSDELWDLCNRKLAEQLDDHDSD